MWRVDKSIVLAALAVLTTRKIIAENCAYCVFFLAKHFFLGKPSVNSPRIFEESLSYEVQSCLASPCVSRFEVCLPRCQVYLPLGVARSDQDSQSGAQSPNPNLFMMGHNDDKHGEKKSKR